MNLLGERSVHRKVQALLRQLKDERALLLQGRIEDLSGLLPRLQALTEEIEQIETEQDQKLAGMLDQVRGAAKRNQGLVEASLKGLQAARLKLRQIEESRVQLNTYTGTGQRREITGNAPTREKRS